MNAKLEQYVEEVGKRLSALPAEERERELAEVRAHLDALVAAQEAAGLDAEAAEREALRQFDAERRVGRDLARANWRARFRRGIPAPARVTVFGLGTAFLTGCISFPLISASLHAAGAMPAPGGWLGVWLRQFQQPGGIVGILCCTALFALYRPVEILTEARSSQSAAGAAMRWGILGAILTLVNLWFQMAAMRLLTPAGSISPWQMPWWTNIVTSGVLAMAVAARSRNGAYRGIVLVALIDLLLVSSGRAMSESFRHLVAHLDWWNAPAAIALSLFWPTALGCLANIAGAMAGGALAFARSDDAQKRLA